MKKIVFIIIITCLFTNCTKDEYLNGIVFNAEIFHIEPFSVSVLVTHNATNDDAYYDFVIEGETQNINAEIEKFLFSIDYIMLEESTHYQRKSKLSIGGLKPNTTYTYIVFGMNYNNKIYGKPCAITFTTPNSNLTASINPNWEIKYEGHRVYNEIDYSLTTLSVLGNIEERYFMATYPIDVVEKYKSTEEFIGFAISELQDNIQNNNDSEYWFNYNQIRTESTAFYRHLTEGDYISYAIGLDEYCNPTGHFVKTDVYHVDKYPIVPSYANLLGEWILVDKTLKRYKVNFSTKIINKYLIMTGWGNYDSPSIPILVSFSRNDKTISISNQLISKNHLMTFSDGTIAEGNLSLEGIYIDEKGDYYKMANNDSVSAYLTTTQEYYFSGFNNTTLVREENINEALSLRIDGRFGTVRYGIVRYAPMIFPITMIKSN